MMAPLAQSPWLAAVGFVASTAALVVVGACAQSPRSEQRSRARRSCGFDPQICGELAQVRRHVDVVRRFGESHRQSERSCVSKQRIPSVALAEWRQLEESRMHRRRADEIVAAVLGRPHHQRVRLQKLEGRLETREWQVRTVAVDRDDTMEVRDEMFEGRMERRGEPGAELPDNVYSRWQASLDVGHVFNGAHHGHVDARELLDERQCIAQHALGEQDDIARWVRAGQSCLYKAFPGSLGHHHDGPTNAVRSAIDPAAAHVAGSAGLVTARSRFFAIPLRMHQAAPIEPFHVPLIFETPMRG